MEVAPVMDAEGHNAPAAIADLDLVQQQQPVREADLVASSDSKSAEASQASTSDDSRASQQREEHTSKDTSQSLLQQNHTAARTPPSSQSIPAVSGQAAAARRAAADAPVSTSPLVPRIETSFPVAEVRNGFAYSNHSEVKQGQKRTANGHVKTPSASTTVSPISALTKGHKRQTSSTSQVGELSAQLRARLSYAMVKVQNGWESRTIDEVESLASQQPSPMSAAPSPRREFDSPRTNISRLYDDRAGFAQSSERTTLPPDQALSAPHLQNGTVGQTYAFPPYTQSAYTCQPQFDASVYQPHNSLTNGHGAPSLAPPVDFSANNPRRTKQSQPFSGSHLLIGARNSSNISASSTSSGSVRSAALPATPPQSQPPTLLKTPSQKATAMEKDAIATLIYMSSPGNSQPLQNSQPYQHQYQSQLSNSQMPGTPLRSGFLASDQDSQGAYVDTIPISPRKKGLLDHANLKSGESIDRVLDQMHDEESSSDDDGDVMVGVVGSQERVAYT